MDEASIEAFFLNHDDPWFERIQEAASEKVAIDMATRVLIQALAPAFDKKDLKAVIRKIRA